MLDPLSTLFSEVQRESQQGQIGRQAHDAHAYSVLFGDGTQPLARRRPIRVALVVSALSVIGVGLVWLAQF
jgi:hypothetical protein